MLESSGFVKYSKNTNSQGVILISKSVKKVNKVSTTGIDSSAKSQVDMAATQKSTRATASAVPEAPAVSAVPEAPAASAAPVTPATPLVTAPEASENPAPEAAIDNQRRARREKLLPVFIRDIIKDYTSNRNHCNQAFIRTKLEEDYGVFMDRRTVRRNLEALLDEDLFIFGDSTKGYWYDRSGYYPE